MSVTLTEAFVVDRSKTVTPRLGWAQVDRGHHDHVVPHGDGPVTRRWNIDPLVRLADVVIVAIGQEPLDAITDEDVGREGFLGKNREWFLEFFTHHLRCSAHDEVTRIEWRYLTTLTTNLGDPR